MLWIGRLMALGCLVAAGCASATRVSHTTHRGWTNAWVLGNGIVEAVIVPETGRVMQFRFAGQTDGPFWENPDLFGRSMPDEPWSASHGSFGGDKTWPAPQGAWNWPPPDVFDSRALKAHREEDTLVLISPVSPRFGIRTERRVSIAPGEPVLRIRTRFVKVTGAPVDVGVWVITQARDPVAVFVPIPGNSRFPEGTATQWGVPLENLERVGNLLRLTRDPKASHKIGNDAGTMVWIGTDSVLRIDIPRVPGGVYADEGCSVEVYTNPDPVPYVELETLGPQRRLAAGDTLEATNTYTLFRRTVADDSEEARRVLASRSAVSR